MVGIAGYVDFGAAPEKAWILRRRAGDESGAADNSASQWTLVTADLPRLRETAMPAVA